MVKTRMFEIAYERGMTVEGIARVGGERYTAQYLRAIKAGLRAVPRSADFQQWAAGVFGLTVEDLFYEEVDAAPMESA